VTNQKEIEIYGYRSKDGKKFGIRRNLVRVKQNRKRRHK
jgi:hypothetical protein